ncbi:MAG TPA: phenylalanine--tRNA ligase subunit alpha [Candidatus Omnitrophota bacterium]|nr:phenylalanine--tRNA ligase subunit alpha [Candidatus Omnitrophota bacterium]
MDLSDKLDELKTKFDEAVSKCSSLRELADLRVIYLGRKGELTQILRGLAGLSPEEKRNVGQKANTIKIDFEQGLNALAEKIENAETVGKAKKFDVTVPGIEPHAGTVHPITKTMNRMSEIFVSLGFRIADGPEIENEFYNFEALNIPLEHPARDGFDTFYIKGKYLLRSHTSNVQIHVMQTQKPPVQVIMPGRVYRPDAVDASHSFMFHQVEGLMVGKKVSFADLKGVLLAFCQSMFGPDIKIRLRPNYFPFTEPSAEVDISCIICKGKGCRLCSGNGWLEILGAGMVNPKVFEAVGYDPEEYTGFAFGMGVERITLLLYGIDDIRLFYENDIRFLKQFR